MKSRVTPQRQKRLIGTVAPSFCNLGVKLVRNHLKSLCKLNAEGRGNTSRRGEATRDTRRGQMPNRCGERTVCQMSARDVELVSRRSPRGITTPLNPHSDRLCPHAQAHEHTYCKSISGDRTHTGANARETFCGELDSTIGVSVGQEYYSSPEGVVSTLTGRHKYSSTSSPRVNGCPSAANDTYTTAWVWCSGILSMEMQGRNTKKKKKKKREKPWRTSVHMKKEHTDTHTLQASLLYGSKHGSTHNNAHTHS